MVSFHPEIPYAEALRRGAVQARILQELDPGGAVSPEPAFDLARADVLVHRELTEIG